MRNKSKYLSITLLTLMLAVVLGAGFSSEQVQAATEGTKNIGVTVETTCTFTNSASTFSVILSPTPGTPEDTLGWTDLQKPPFTVTCNDLNGFKVQAVGFSPNSTSPTDPVETATALYSSAGTIPTGTGTGTDSYWAFRISAVSATGTTATTSYGAANTWYAVPDSRTSVADFAATGTGSVVTGSVRSDYKVYASPLQPAGTYTGGVKYIMVGNS